VLTVDGEQTKTTEVIRKTLNPYWNQSFDVYVAPPHCHDIDCMRTVKESSIIAVQIFDQRKFKKKDQGFLGVINCRVGDILDLQLGGDGTGIVARKANYRNVDKGPEEIQ
jgi:E3 ubiquitin-protein ligase NEDD4